MDGALMNLLCNNKWSDIQETRVPGRGVSAIEIMADNFQNG